MIFDVRTKKLEKNVVVFATHKAGSMLLHRVLTDICSANRIPYYSPNGSGSKKIPFDKIFAGEDFLAGHNGCFGPLRFFIPSTILPKSNVVVHLRDPRDVLTSMFYSYCFMHPPKYKGEVEANTGHRKQVAEAGIDKFVLDMSDENYARYQGDYGTGCNFGASIGSVRHRYDVYLKEIVGKPNVVVLSYEEMVGVFPSWLNKLVSAFGLNDGGKTYSSIMEGHSASVKPEGEDIWSHKRKVTPGDFREKLKPETIAELNSRFRDTLDVLGYSSPKYDTVQVPVLRVG